MPNVMNNLYNPAYSPYDIPPLYSQLTHPIRLLTRLIDVFFSLLRPTPQLKLGVTLVCISDTHNLIPVSLPPGDILIHAGDLTNNGSPEEIQAQYDWLLSQPHRYKIVIAGNHDPWFKDIKSSSLQTRYGPLYDSSKNRNNDGIIYLQNTSITLKFSQGSLKIYGDPHTPDILGPEHVFQYPRSQDFWKDRIPSDADIVITHGPPACHLDLLGVNPMGCESLLGEVKRVKPRVHVFGHIHAGKSDWIGIVRDGQEVVVWDDAERVFARVMKRNAEEGVLLLVRFVVTGFWGLFCDLVLRRKAPSTRMVNAAMMYCNTGKLANEPQVVHL